MAKKKTHSQGSWRLSTALWMLLTSLSSGGIGAYFNRDLPLVGSILEYLQAEGEQGSLNFPPLGNPAVATAENVSHPPAASSAVPTRLASSQRPNDRLLIATFNIQVFGESKLAKTDVMPVLVQIIRQFDIVAIQEVRAKSDEILPRFLAAINADGSRYNYLIGPRLGRSVSTEQYAFIFDTNRIEHDPSSIMTIEDPKDVLHREPFMARFRPRTAAPEKAFSFWLVNIHTDPDEVRQEVDAMADVFQVIQSARPDEDDVIILGDLNASSSQLSRLGQIPGIQWVVNGSPTNTLQSKAYDNLIFGASTREYTGRWGVMDIEQIFGISREQALRVSDHLPVWAEFSIWEAPQSGAFADRNQGGLR